MDVICCLHFMAPGAVGRLHYHHIGILYVFRIVYYRLIKVSDITGEDYFLLFSVLIDEDLDRRTAKQVSGINEPYGNLTVKDAPLPILRFGKEREGVVGIFLCVERFLHCQKSGPDPFRKVSLSS